MHHHAIALPTLWGKQMPLPCIMPSKHAIALPTFVGETNAIAKHNKQDKQENKKTESIEKTNK